MSETIGLKFTKPQKIESFPDMYAVIKNLYPEKVMPLQFTVLYDDYSEAKAEAERLCLKERCEFWVIRVVAKCSVAGVRWEE